MEEQPQPLPEQVPDEQPEAPKPRCPNCDKKLPKEAKFCPKCGQKQGAELLKMTELLSKVWDKLFHIDNKFLRMSWHLLIPARVTTAYFKGQIKRYPHPIQFFFICMFLLLVYVNQTST